MSARRTSRPSASPTSARPPSSGIGAPGKPIHNAIVWQDRRTAGICDRLRARKLDRVIRRKTGLVIDAYFSGTKVQWILQNVKGARARAKAGELAFGTVDSWLVWNLTGGKVHVTDASNASRTMLFDISKGDWDDELLKLFDVPRSMLPEVRSSSEVYGETNLLGTPIPIAGIAGDQQAALFGQACTKPGMAKNTYGTGCFMLMNTGTKRIASKNNLLTTVAWRIGDRTDYALEGSVFIAGAVVQWLRDGLEFFRSAAEIEALAASVSDTGGVYLVPAFAGLGAPHWDQYARGHDRRIDARIDEGAHRPRRARGDRAAGDGCPQSDGSRRRHQAERAARRRRSERERPADAIAGGHVERPRRPTQGCLRRLRSAPRTWRV